MNEVELKRLLDKYFSGESTEKEEGILREYFRGGNIPAGYESEKDMFGYYSASAEIPEPSPDFEARIIKGIDDYEKKKETKGLRRIILPYLSAAAGILIMVGLYFFVANKREPEDTFADPKVAYAETIKILVSVSSKLNEGTQALEPVGKINDIQVKSLETINKSTVMVEKKLKNLGQFQKAVDIVNVPLEKKSNKNQ